MPCHDLLSFWYSYPTLFPLQIESRGEFYSWNAFKSPDRFRIYKRKMHRSMILHRELLRCLPKRSRHRVGSRALDLDR